MKITQVNNRFVVETVEGRLHILNEKSLRWNLKRVFGRNAAEVAKIVMILKDVGTIEIAA
jgi:hypothetical protein